MTNVRQVTQDTNAAREQLPIESSLALLTVDLSDRVAWQFDTYQAHRAALHAGAGAGACLQLRAVCMYIVQSSVTDLNVMEATKRDKGTGIGWTAGWLTPVAFDLCGRVPSEPRTEAVSRRY